MRPGITTEADALRILREQRKLLRAWGMADLKSPAINELQLRGYLASCPEPPESLPGDRRERHWYVVYALIDPRDGSAWYIGTTCLAGLRLQGHMSLKDKVVDKNAWVGELLRQGHEPLMRQIDVVRGDGMATDAREYGWIQLCYRLGMPLTNRAGLRARHPASHLWDGSERPLPEPHCMLATSAPTPFVEAVRRAARVSGMSQNQFIVEALRNYPPVASQLEAGSEEQSA